MGNSRPSLRVVTLLENNPYPADARVRPHMEALVAAGCHVTVIALHRRGQPWQEIVNGVRVYRFPLPRGTNATAYALEFLCATILSTMLTLWVWLCYGLDVLHIYNPPDCLFVAALLPRLADKTIVYDVRDLAPELYQAKFEGGSSLLHKLLVRLESISCRLVDHIVTVNESYRRIIMERHQVPAKKISIVRQGPDPAQIHPVETDLVLRQRADIIIAYLGTISNIDGIDHLFRALHHLDQQFGHKDWLCVLIGPADESKTYQALATELGISDRTWFTGYMPNEQWIRVVSTADIGVEPEPFNSLTDISTCNKLMDYMALGLPSVAYDLHENHVTAGEAALYARPNDELDMARQFAVLIENPSLRSQLGMIGRKRIEDHLAWEHQKEHLLTLYATLTHGNPACQAG
jgi:glycosyltransferase involved in cell wall biosynthesis